MQRTGIRVTMPCSFLCLALSSFRAPFPSLDDHGLSISVCVCAGVVHPSVYAYASKATYLTHHRISLPLLLPFPGLLPSFYTLQTRLPSTGAHTQSSKGCRLPPTPCLVSLFLPGLFLQLSIVSPLPSPRVLAVLGSRYGENGLALPLLLSLCLVVAHRDSHFKP